MKIKIEKITAEGVDTFTHEIDDDLATVKPNDDVLALVQVRRNLHNSFCIMTELSDKYHLQFDKNTKSAFETIENYWGRLLGIAADDQLTEYFGKAETPNQ